VEQAHQIRFRDYFAPELQRLQGLQGDGLVELAQDGIRVTDMGWFFVRGVAMVFDRYLQDGHDRARFSKII
jgi:oxygen-independent coproporphyrinogen-3 oxidase